MILTTASADSARGRRRPVAGIGANLSSCCAASSTRARAIVPTASRARKLRGYAPSWASTWSRWLCKDRRLSTV